MTIDDIASTRPAAPDDLIHPIYLPFRRAQLLQHFAPVGRPAAPRTPNQAFVERHLRYYEQSAATATAHANEQHRQGITGGGQPTGCNAQNHQVEKDERFWIVSALMALFHADDRVEALTAVLTSALGDTPPLPGFSSWQDALAEEPGKELQLFFEVNLPSPVSYRTWMRNPDIRDEQGLIPWIRARNVRAREEGTTKADAMLIAPKTGFAVVFEAKVLSDASTHTERDAIRNQIARTIDVLLDENLHVQPPLTTRRPDRTCFVLVTPQIFKDKPSTRLYGHLMNAYQADTALLHQHLPHRNPDQLASVPKRLGWTTFEACQRIQPTACAWLERTCLGGASAAELVSG